MKLSFVKIKTFGLLLLFIAITQMAQAQQLQTLSLPPDSPRWEFASGSQTCRIFGAQEPLSKRRRGDCERF